MAAAAFARSRIKTCLFENHFKPLVGIFCKEVRSPAFSQAASLKPSFGLLFDIDGVIVRGKKVVPKVPEAFKRLTDGNGKFRVPTLFVTNAGNAHCFDKANDLSKWLGVEVPCENVVMAYTPLSTFHEFHNKCVLVSGQGPVDLIASQLGFKNVVTIDNLREAFPLLDAVDQKRRGVLLPAEGKSNFPKIDAVVLFGEPVRWETSLQLIVDILMTDGWMTNRPDNETHSLPFPHVPVLVCNMDLQWMAEANIPRFGHGAFLVCLEQLYNKITGKTLSYSAMIGKPSEITYQFAHQLIVHQAKMIDHDCTIKRLYAIGDNVNTDIFGANLYNKYLASAKSDEVESMVTSSRISQKMRLSYDSGIESCFSVLVKTGVYTRDLTKGKTVDHSPRDFLGLEKCLRTPTYTVEDAAEAIDMIFNLEEFH